MIRPIIVTQCTICSAFCQKGGGGLPGRWCLKNGPQQSWRLEQATAAEEVEAAEEAFDSVLENQREKAKRLNYASSL
jgi:hypothetical protein